MFYNAREHTLYLQGQAWDYITFGKGEKPFVMIQGLNTNGIHGSALPLAYMYRIFSKEFKVYLFERRKTIHNEITVKDMADDIAMEMDALGITNAAVLGVSQGGMIAQHLAIDRPDLVDRMVLAVTLSENNDTVKSVIEKWIALTEKDDMKTLLTDMTYRMYSDLYVKRYKRLIPLLAILQKPKDKERFILLAKSCLTCNTYEELNKIECPVLVIGGKQDRIIGSLATEKIAEKLSCEIHMYENLGHAAYEEAKDFNQRVYEFFKKSLS